MNTNTKQIFYLLVLILILSSCSSTRKGSTRFDDSSSPYVKEQPKPVVKAKEEPLVSKPATKTEPVVVREEKVKAVDIRGTETIFRYYVIIGSFQVVENARNFRTQLIKESFTPVILHSEIGFYRVSVGSFNDELAARERIAQIRTNYSKYSDVWLLVRKN